MGSGKAAATTVVVVLILVAVVGYNLIPNDIGHNELYNPYTNGGNGGPDDPYTPDPDEPRVPITYNQTLSGNVNEGETTEFTSEIEGTVIWFEANLTWQDESSVALWTNSPDTFTIEVNVGHLTGSDTGENPPGEAGLLNVYLNFGEANAGYWSVNVTLDSAGDLEGPIGLIAGPDNSNSFDLQITYLYFES
jgi:hypothetical protein